jgi:phage I-like protein
MSARHDEVHRAFEALSLKARTGEARAPTVASVAARANISRSSMYRFHPEVVARIQALSAPMRAAQRDTLRAKARLLGRQLQAERELAKALARACAELAAEKTALTEFLEEERLRSTLRIESLQKKLRGERAGNINAPP